MLRTLPTFRAHAEALDALGRSKTPTTALLHRACATFAQMVAEIERMPVKVSVGQTVIAREQHARQQA
jgi:hypothetical protein